MLPHLPRSPPSHLENAHSLARPTRRSAPPSPASHCRPEASSRSRFEAFKRLRRSRRQIYCPAGTLNHLQPAWRWLRPGGTRAGCGRAWGVRLDVLQCGRCERWVLEGIGGVEWDFGGVGSGRLPALNRVREDAAEHSLKNSRRRPRIHSTCPFPHPSNRRPPEPRFPFSPHQPRLPAPTSPLPSSQDPFIPSWPKSFAIILIQPRRASLPATFFCKS